jgi:hypothetical protein
MILELKGGELKGELKGGEFKGGSGATPKAKRAAKAAKKPKRRR